MSIAHLRSKSTQSRIPTQAQTTGQHRGKNTVSKWWFNRSSLAPQGNLQCLETFSMVMIGMGITTVTQRVEATGATDTLQCAGQSPQQSPSPNVWSAEMEKAWLQA